jgi:hypothetical protein
MTRGKKFHICTETKKGKYVPPVWLSGASVYAVTDIGNNTFPEMEGSNTSLLSYGTPEFSLWYWSLLLRKCQDRISIMQWLFLAKSFPVHYSSPMLSV